MKIYHNMSVSVLSIYKNHFLVFASISWLYGACGAQSVSFEYSINIWKYENMLRKQIYILRKQIYIIFYFLIGAWS